MPLPAGTQLYVVVSAVKYCAQKITRSVAFADYYYMVLLFVFPTHISPTHTPVHSQCALWNAECSDFAHFS